MKRLTLSRKVSCSELNIVRGIMAVSPKGFARS
jgi:hypothetical protein